MGRNAAIKRYDPAVGQTLDLIADKAGRTPIVIELLRSPWIFKAADLARCQDTALGKRCEEVVAVAWDGRQRCPVAFERRGRSYRIDGIAQLWAVERYWWDPRRRVSWRCWRVLARGGTYDLAYDRLERRWLLVGIQD